MGSEFSFTSMDETDLSAESEIKRITKVVH